MMYMYLSKKNVRSNSNISVQFLKINGFLVFVLLITSLGQMGFFTT